MGCDIHLVLETRHNGDWIAIDTFTGHSRPKWSLKEDEHDYSIPVARGRNYERFAALAGVRGFGPPPRGVPIDASQTARYLIDYYGVNGHSHSWLPLDEATRIWKGTAGELGDFENKYPESYFFGVDVSEGSEPSIDDYRVVFWFDS